MRPELSQGASFNRMFTVINLKICMVIGWGPDARPITMRSPCQKPLICVYNSDK